MTRPLLTKVTVSPTAAVTVGGVKPQRAWSAGSVTLTTWLAAEAVSGTSRSGSSAAASSRRGRLALIAAVYATARLALHRPDEPLVERAGELRRLVERRQRDLAEHRDERDRVRPPEEEHVAARGDVAGDDPEGDRLVADAGCWQRVEPDRRLARRPAVDGVEPPERERGLGAPVQADLAGDDAAACRRRIV